MKSSQHMCIKVPSLSFHVGDREGAHTSQEGTEKGHTPPKRGQRRGTYLPRGDREGAHTSQEGTEKGHIPPKRGQRRGTHLPRGDREGAHTSQEGTEKGHTLPMTHTSHDRTDRGRKTFASLADSCLSTGGRLLV